MRTKPFNIYSYRWSARGNQSWRDGNSLTRVNCTIVIFPVKRSVRGGLGGSGKEYIDGNLIPPVPTGEAINQAINDMQKRLAKMKRR